MEAQGRFFGGTVEVAVLLAHAGMKWDRGEGAGEADAHRHHRGGHEGFHGGFRGGFGGGRGGFRGERGGEGREGGERGEAAENEGSSGPPIRAENERPLDLRLRLINHGSKSLKVEVLDFNSMLGDFAVQPDTIAVPAGGSAEAEPMVSRLGVSLPKIPLTVQLRVDGKTEQQVLMLRPLKPPAPRPGAAPPSAGSAR